MSRGDIVLVVLAVPCVLLAGLLAGIEAAVTRVSRVAVEELVRDERKGARALAAIVADPPRYVNLLLLLRTAFELAATSFVVLVVVHAMGARLAAIAVASLGMTVVSYVVVAGRGDELVHREGQHVGRSRLVHPPLVQPLHGLHVDEQHRKLGERRHPTLGEHVPCHGDQRPLVDRDAGLVGDEDGHWIG